eukprot:312877-Prorocentrum_minimum.AAC.1
MSSTSSSASAALLAPSLTDQTAEEALDRPIDGVVSPSDVGPASPTAGPSEGSPPEGAEGSAGAGSERLYLSLRYLSRRLRRRSRFFARFSASLPASCEDQSRAPARSAQPIAPVGPVSVPYPARRPANPHTVGWPLVPIVTTRSARVAFSRSHLRRRLLVCFLASAARSFPLPIRRPPLDGGSQGRQLSRQLLGRQLGCRVVPARRRRVCHKVEDHLGGGDARGGDARGGDARRVSLRGAGVDAQPAEGGPRTPRAQRNLLWIHLRAHLRGDDVRVSGCYMQTVSSASGR